MQFLIRADEPFRGHAQSVLNPDGTVAYSNGLTVEQYQKERGFKVKAISESEMLDLVRSHQDSMKTKPQRTTRARFVEMLTILPPSRWHYAGGFEVFHLSEALAGDLVSWFACKNGRYSEFTESSRLSDAQLVSLFREAAQ